MADGLAVRTNLPDFRRQLAELGQRMERRIVARATRAAGTIFRDQARRLAPVLKTPDPRRIRGLLARRIFVGRSRFGQKGQVFYYVGVRTAVRRSNVQKLKVKRSGRAADPFYWRFLEGGWIGRGRGSGFTGGRRLRAVKRARAAAAGSARFQVPFLAPAFERGKARALAAFTEELEKELAAESRRGGAL